MSHRHCSAVSGRFDLKSGTVWNSYRITKATREAIAGVVNRALDRLHGLCRMLMAITTCRLCGKHFRPKRRQHGKGSIRSSWITCRACKVLYCAVCGQAKEPRINICTPCRAVRVWVGDLLHGLYSEDPDIREEATITAKARLKALHGMDMHRNNLRGMGVNKGKNTRVKIGFCACGYLFLQSRRYAKLKWCSETCRKAAGHRLPPEFADLQVAMRALHIRIKNAEEEWN